MKLFIFVFLLSYQAFANEHETYEVVEQGRALTWIKARNLCLDLGADWDLPTLKDIQDQKVPTSKFNKVNVLDLKTQNLSSYYLIWTRSNEDELNGQFLRLSQALKIDLESGLIDSYPMSALRTEQMYNYLSQLVVNRDAISRSDSDHEVLMSFLELYDSTELGRRYPLDSDLPLSQQPDYVIMLPETVIPQNILLILSKPSRRYVDTTIENVRYELEATNNGLEVLCVKSSNF
jgi:hypothetical protein